MGNQGTVTRYVVTHLNNGKRTLAHSALGRDTYATRAEAKAWITSARKANGARLGEILGEPLEVRACECWAGHFDPVSIYFD